MKTCTKCGEEKPLGEYHKDKTKKQGRRSDCKACVKLYQVERRSRKEVKERHAQYCHDYYRTHRDEILENAWNYRKQAYVRKREMDRSTKYRKENPHVAWEAGYRFRAKQFGVVPVIKRFTLDDFLGRYGDQCVDCGAKWEQVDHVVPIRFGGEHSIDNCEPVCQSCNIKRWQAIRKKSYDLMANIYSGEAA